jgi:hypothetical protein
MIYNHLSREIGARSVLDQRPQCRVFWFNFPALEMYHLRSLIHCSLR